MKPPQFCLFAGLFFYAASLSYLQGAVRVLGGGYGFSAGVVVDASNLCLGPRPGDIWREQRSETGQYINERLGFQQPRHQRYEIQFFSGWLLPSHYCRGLFEDIPLGGLLLFARSDASFWAYPTRLKGVCLSHTWRVEDFGASGVGYPNVHSASSSISFGLTLESDSEDLVTLSHQGNGGNGWADIVHYNPPSSERIWPSVTGVFNPRKIVFRGRLDIGAWNECSAGRLGNGPVLGAFTVSWSKGQPHSPLTGTIFLTPSGSAPPTDGVTNAQGTPLAVNASAASVFEEMEHGSFMDLRLGRDILVESAKTTELLIPPGYMDGPVTVWAGGRSLGEFPSGRAVNFEELTGGPVSSFAITGLPEGPGPLPFAIESKQEASTLDVRVYPLVPETTPKWPVTGTASPHDGGTIQGLGLVYEGSQAVIRAVPAPRYRFVSWSGQGIADPLAAQTRVLVTGPADVTATFLLVDHDDDGLDDDWEQTHFGNLDPTGAGDADGDTLSNATEEDLGTNPKSRDSDNDGYSDPWEAAKGHGPTDAASPNPAWHLHDAAFGEHEPEVRLEGNALTTRYLRRRDAAANALAYAPQFSENLSNWTVPTAVESVTPVDAHWEEVRVRHELAASATRAFGRVNVQLGPP